MTGDPWSPADLAAAAPADDDALTDADRYPALTEHGERMLRFLREHPHAPIYRNQSGNRLTAADLERVRAFDAQVRAARPGWEPGQAPPWLDGFVDQCLEEVPFYRRYGSRPRDFHDLPTVTRADLGRDVAAFVPDPLPTDRIINFRTSGTTGHPLLLPSHPIVAASYLAFHRRALRRFGIELAYGRGQVGVVLVGFQRTCFTYVSVTPLMDDSGLAKINLHPDDWRDPADRVRYLDALAPEVYTGDPLSLAELAALPLSTKPRALLSTSMALQPGLRARLQARFGCPVLDLYSLNESGPVAVYDDDEGGHVLLQHRMYVEVLDDAGRPVPPGERGEVTLTGGFNPYLPLLRYRTGDHAALRVAPGREPVLVGLQGRPPVRFRTAAGEWLNNIEVTHALQRFALSQWTLHQQADGALRFRFAGPGADADTLRHALAELFGGQAMEVREGGFDGDKVVQYTSELEGARP
ncbi:AMP-binding protein [Longimicrobium sp.]|uniref:AMP-binding protein n=1 Tax=Longimicrobium sp. TaxID=2029185 RepID=UPI003B3A8408